MQQLRRLPDGRPGNAEVAGMRVNDVITAVNGRAVRLPELSKAVRDRPEGQVRV